MQTYTKHRSGAPRGFFEAEAAGLGWLAAANGAAVVEVVDVGPDSIVLQHLEDAVPSAEAAYGFGGDLAKTHDAGAAAFGAPPTGWRGPNFIGSRAQTCVPEQTWGRFYGPQRVAPFLRAARDADSVTVEEARTVDAAIGRIVSGDFDDDAPPARIHGDLWNGNVLFTPSGVVLIDPAAHGGHRETDLAMLALFGCPYLGDIIAGYEAVHPLRDDWADRVPLHQLHPLAVHAAGYGRSYGRALVAAANRTLAL